MVCNRYLLWGFTGVGSASYEAICALQQIESEVTRARKPAPESGRRPRSASDAERLRKAACARRARRGLVRRQLTVEDSSVGWREAEARQQ